MGETATWGISGPTFLGLYIVGFVIFLGVMLLVRAGIWRRHGAPAKVEPDDLHPCDLALLGGGDDLAATVALLHLRRAKILGVERRSVATPRDTTDAELELAGPTKIDTAARELASSFLARSRAVVPTGTLSVRAHPVERAVYHEATVRSLAPRNLLAAAGVTKAVDAAREELRRTGLAADHGTVRRLRWATAILLVPLAVGGTRLVVGLARSRPIGFLLVLFGLTVWLSVRLLRKVRVDRPCPAVARLFFWARLSRRRQRRAAAVDLGRTDSGAALLGLSAVALFGTGLLWEANDFLASSLDVPSALAGGVSTVGWTGWTGNWGGADASGGWGWGGGGGGGGGCGGGGGGGCGGGGCGGG
jgi:uncharacterized protein (TIGR04222 family)